MTAHPSGRGLAVVRAGVAATMFIHGAHRLLAGGVVPFGEFLSTVGLPAGVAVAGALTAVELLGAPLLAAGRLTRPLAAWFAVQLAVGIALVHGREGWFVVGAGRNGMEFSALLILCLAAVAIGEEPGSRGDAAR